MRWRFRRFRRCAVSQIRRSSLRRSSTGGAWSPRTWLISFRWRQLGGASTSHRTRVSFSSLPAPFHDTTARSLADSSRHSSGRSRPPAQSPARSRGSSQLRPEPSGLASAAGFRGHGVHRRPMAPTLEPASPSLDRRRHRGRVLLSRSGRSEPGRKCLRQLWGREVSRPGDMSVGSDQHGRGSSDLAKDRELHTSLRPRAWVPTPSRRRPSSGGRTSSGWRNSAPTRREGAGLDQSPPAVARIHDSGAGDLHVEERNRRRHLHPQRASPPPPPSM